MEIRDGTLSAKLLRPIHPLVALRRRAPGGGADARAGDRRRSSRSWSSTAGERLLRPRSALLASSSLASLVGAWLLIFFTMVLHRHAGVLRRERARHLRAVARRARILSGYLVPLELLPALGARRRATCCRSASCSAFPVETLIGLLDAARGAARRSPCSGPTWRCSAWLALLRLARGRAPLRGVRGLTCATLRSPSPPLRRPAARAAAHVGADGHAVPRRLPRARLHRAALDGGDAGAAARRLRRAPAASPAGRSPRRWWSSAGSRCCTAILEGAVSPSLTAVVEHIRKGTLDFVLLKPADAQFLVSTAKFEPWRVVDVAGRAGDLRLRLHAAGPLAAAARELALALVLLVAGGR